MTKQQAHLLLEQGLVQAAQNDPRAANSLNNFVRDFPTNKRVSEAWVALAEIAFHASPPRLDEAAALLRRAMESHPTPLARERADYLNIWIEETSPNADSGKIISLANQFLRDHPNSNFTRDVRMKLAETYYRAAGFANAQTQFELLPHRIQTDRWPRKLFSSLQNRHWQAWDQIRSNTR